MGVVYIHTNLLNNKVYVGQTENPHQRKLDHCNPSVKTPFSKAIQKYGWDNFLHYESDTLDNHEDVNNLERLWIILLEATDPTHGYNRRHGGGRGAHTERTKQLLRIARARQGPPSPEGRKRISEANKGNKHNVGRKLPEETLRKLSESHRGIKQRPDWIRKRVESRRRTLQAQGRTH